MSRLLLVLPWALALVLLPLLLVFLLFYDCCVGIIHQSCIIFSILHICVTEAHSYEGGVDHGGG